MRTPLLGSEGGSTGVATPPDSGTALDVPSRSCAEPSPTERSWRARGSGGRRRYASHARPAASPSGSRPLDARSWATADRSSATSPSSIPCLCRAGSFASVPSACAVKLRPLGTCTYLSPKTLSSSAVTFGTSRTPRSCRPRISSGSEAGLSESASSRARQICWRGSSCREIPWRSACLISLDVGERRGSFGSPGRSPRSLSSWSTILRDLRHSKRSFT